MLLVIVSSEEGSATEFCSSQNSSRPFFAVLTKKAGDLNNLRLDTG